MDEGISDLISVFLGRRGKTVSPFLLAENDRLLYTLSMEVTLKNGIPPRGTVTVPPSKSEAIRAALLLGICGKEPRRAVEAYTGPFCDDISRALTVFSGRPDAGASASLLRMLLPVLLALHGRAEVACSQRLIERGVNELEECLGIRAERTETGLIMEDVIEKSRFELDCSRSSQFLSGLLIALPLLPRECVIEIKNGLVSGPYADMTLDFVRRFGGKIEKTAKGYITRPSAYSAPNTIPVTGDHSYAAVFRAMNFLSGNITIEGASEETYQPDKRFLELVGRDECDISDCPDLMPLLAVCACGRRGDTLIRGTARLRSKESDREAGTVGLINDLGGSAEVLDDAVIVHGRGSLDGGIIDPMDDHRLAFAAAAAAIICRRPVTVKNAECVNKSAPAFWKDCERVNMITTIH